MKKLYILTILAFATGITAQAQRVSYGNVLPANYEINRDFNREVTDTIGASVLEGCDLAPALSAAATGWISGGNNFGDLEKAQFINAEGSGSIYSVIAWIGAKQGGIDESYTAKIYSGDVTDGPDAVLGTSNSVSYADLDTTGIYTTFSFDTPLAYDAPFFISFEVSMGDAIYGIVHSGVNCGGNSSWELWEGGTSWNSINEAWTGDTDVILYTFAEVETSTVGLDDTNLIERGSEKIFPNPANESANLVFSLVQPSEITVRIYSTTGVLVDTYNPGIKNTGLSNITINTQSMSQGLYIYSIETEKGVRTGNFAVVR